MFRKMMLCTIVLALAALCLMAALAEAPVDAYVYNGHCYKAYTGNLSWDDAKAACEKMNGHLMTITSSGEQGILSKLGLQKGTNYWLGGTDAGHERDWRWITGEKWKYTYWGNSQPDNRQLYTGVTENYLQICVDWGNRWNDSDRVQDKTAKCGYICEWETAGSLSDAVVTLKESQLAYTGEALTPEPTVTLNGRALVKGKDYKLTYSNNKNVGTASVKASGIGTYKSSKTVKFNICYDLSKASVSLSRDSYNYAGKAIKPWISKVRLTVKGKKITILSSTGYNTSYEDNKAPGMGKVVITGKKKCMGTAYAEFSISLKKPSISKTTGKTGGIKVTWNSVAGADYYEIRCVNVADSGDVRHVDTRTWQYDTVADKILTGKKYSTTVSGLTSKTQYNVTVRAMANNGIESAWSKAVKCKAK